MRKYLVIIGPIAAGKGTQADRISAKYNMPHISTGQLFRKEIKDETEIGVEIKDNIESGGLVPDDITNCVVRRVLDGLDLSKGFIFDGYPRSVEQSKAFFAMLAERGVALDAAVKLDIAEDEIVRRISGRFTCAVCGQNYHDPDVMPKVKGVCDRCGSRDFIRRSDDRPEVIRRRLENYYLVSRPIEDFYRARGLLFEIDGTKLTADGITA
ncbi:MAG: adenylate kinase, partial [Rickettsiales bacterium]|nr:adenylate kinase [Rickettsiales bacterium]